MKVILASKNQHKLTELSAILSQLGFEIALESEYGLDIDVEETGTTFEENSFLKADAVMKASGLPVLADDSGLMVDALDGAPGVYSARYGHKASDKERTAYLLENMKDVPEERRGAKFVCVITCLFPDGRKIVARGECPGVIARAPHGENGFGYDPVFYLPELGMTYAEYRTMTSKERAALRAQANTIDTTLMVGKGGVSETLVAEAQKLLDIHELVKGRVLETAMMTPREVCDALCEATGAEGIQVVGSKFVIWRKSEKVEQEKKQAAKKAAAPKKVSGNYNPVKAGITRRKQQAKERRKQQKEYFHEAAVKAAIERRKQQEG